MTFNFSLSQMKSGHLALLLLLPIMSGAGYEFTFTNPSVGDFDAPFVLEYFSKIDCSPCSRFETEYLDELADLVDEGHVRIVFRDLLPEPEYLSDSIHLFCLQEFPDFLNRRILAKQTQVWTGDKIKLSGLARARYRACLESANVESVLSHNQTAFQAHGFRGTPSFLLTRIGQSPDDGWFAGGHVTPSDVRFAIFQLNGGNPSVRIH